MPYVVIMHTLPRSQRLPITAGSDIGNISTGCWLKESGDSSNNNRCFHCPWLPTTVKVRLCC